MIAICIFYRLYDRNDYHIALGNSDRVRSIQIYTKSYNFAKGNTRRGLVFQMNLCLNFDIIWISDNPKKHSRPMNYLFSLEMIITDQMLFRL